MSEEASGEREMYSSLLTCLCCEAQISVETHDVGRREVALAAKAKGWSIDCMWRFMCPECAKKHLRPQGHRSMRS